MDFGQIPTNLKVPLFWIEMDPSQAGYSLQTKRALLIGQKLSSAPAPVATGTAFIVGTLDQAKAFFGVGSMLARMYETYRKNDPFGEVWCIALADNGAGVAATGTITVTGPATAAGTINLYVAGQRVQIAVAAADSANTIAAAINTAINAATDLPVTSTVSTNVVTPLCRWKGATGNDIQILDTFRGSAGGEALPAGVGLAYVAMASGATNPAVTAAITAMGDEEYDYVIHPYTDSTNLDLLQTEFNETAGRWSWLRQIYGHCYTALRGTLGSLVSAGTARNDPHQTIAAIDVDTQSPSWEYAAAYGARNAVFLNASLVKSTYTGDLVGILPARAGKRFIASERQSLLGYGIATSYYSGGLMHVERAITTYQKNALGLADASYFDSEIMHKNADFNREMRAISGKYARHGLANSGTAFDAGVDILTPAVYRNELINLYKRMERAGKVENAALFEKYLIVERDADNPNRLNVLAPPDLTNHLRILAVRNQFRLQYPATA